MIQAIVALAIIGGVLGLILGIANTYLVVEEDERVTVVTEKLPGVNCGGCGYPGCAGLANALVEGSVTSVSKCVVANTVAKEAIADYINNAAGTTVQVKP
jgi:electron transport complex protein RnfB